MKVIKRNGTEVEFDKDKIIKAIEKAMYETELGIDSELSEEIAYNIQEDVLEMGITPTVNSIQDMVEEYLMNSVRKDVAKRYILYRVERDKNRDKIWDMTDLQRDIYEKKYRFEGESFSEFLDRVSAGNTHIRKLMQQKRFLPAGRILANRGLNQRGKKVCYSNCFPAGMRVYTDEGYKNIEDVRVGDMVLTHKGRFRKVVNTLKREFDGTLSTIKVGANRKVISTNEHPYLTSNGWVNAENLTSNDYIKVIKGDYTLPSITFDILEGFELRHDREIKEFDDGKVKLITNYVDKNGIHGGRHSHSINRYIPLTDDLAYAMGYWVGDGSITKRQDNDINSIFQIVAHKKNVNIINRLKEIFYRHFGIELHVTENAKQNLLILKTDNPILCEWVYRNFGKYCDGKFIPKYLKNNMSFILGLLDADGMIMQNQSIRLVLNNRDIIENVNNYLEYLGYPTNGIRYTGRDGWDSWGFDIPAYVSKKIIPMMSKTYDDGRENIINDDISDYAQYLDGDLYLKIKRIDKFNLKEISTLVNVYNLSVDEDESYIVNGLVVHNCFVNEPPQDNIESIFHVAGQMARTYSYGGGVGISLENLRPKGAVVNNSADHTTGAVSFMDLYSTTTGLIGMRGRRGALILTLPISHPDIEDFIDVKNDLSKVNFANISIMISDDFMKAVKNNETWELKFHVKDTGETISKKVSATKLFNKIAESNWRMAEPGMLFWDRINNYHLNSEIESFKYSAVNPCGEVPLPKGGSCLLSSINLSEYVINPFQDNVEFDYKKFVEDIPYIVEFMDDLLEEGIPYLPLEHQKQSARDYRQIGIGVMGLADMLIKMGLTYGSEGSINKVSEIMDVFANEILKASAMLAKSRGVYPKYTNDVLNSAYIKTVANSETRALIEKYGLRNGQLISIAPNGSISTLWGVSGGIEPIFALSHHRRSESLGDGEDVVYKVYAQIVRDYLDATGSSDESDLPEYFIVSHEIDYMKRIEFQGMAQKYVDNAISSTVNLPNSATIDDVKKLYMYAWEQGLKGITIYRDGCMREGILTTTETKKNSVKEVVTPVISKDKCPDCGNELTHSAGCTECTNCGYSACSL